MRKRILWSIIAFVAVFVLLFSACQKTEKQDELTKEETKKEDVNDKEADSGDTANEDEAQPLKDNTMPIVVPAGSTTISFACRGMGADGVDLATSPVWMKVEEVTGIDIDWQIGPAGPDSGADYTTLMQTRLAAGQDLPDILQLPGTIGDAVKYANEGILLKLDDLIDMYAPNIKALYEQYPAIEGSSRTPDGDIYFLINYLLGNENNNLVSVRKDWMDKLDLETPETADDWYNVLLTVKQSDVNGTGSDDIIAFGEEVDYFLSAFNMTSRGGYYWYDKEGKISFFAMRPEFKDYLTYLNKLYEDNLLDPMYGSGESMVDELRKQNKVFCDWSWAATPPVFDGELKDAGFPEANWQFVIPPKSEDGSLSFKTNSIARSDEWYAISVDCENTDVAMRLYDFMYASEEGTRLTICGIEGEDWTLDADGKLQFTDAVANNPDYGLIAYLRNVRGAFVTPMELQTTEFNNARISGKFAENLQLIQDSGGNSQYPVIIPTVGEQEKQAMLFTDIQSYIDEMTIKFVAGKEPMENFDAFQQALTNMNIEELTAVYQQQYDRFVGK